MTNVIPLRPARADRQPDRMARLIEAIATQRRSRGDVFWLKENAELLGVLASLEEPLAPEALAPLAPFFESGAQALRDFPQYYRFILSICLDLEDLGLSPAGLGEALCRQVARAGLEEAELSDLQRAEARRLLSRRNVGQPVGHGALGGRLRRFIDRTRTFALPNRKAAYELTHIVYYLSDYGRRDPSLSADALVSLEYTGILAFLDQDMDLLAEVCAALRFAGSIPSPLWEKAVVQAHGAHHLRPGAGVPLEDDLHQWLVTGWAARIAGAEAFAADVPGGALRVIHDRAPGGALRPLAVCLREMGSARSADWGRMRAHVLSYLNPETHAVLVEAERSSPRFGDFFEGFARAGEG